MEGPAAFVFMVLLCLNEAVALGIVITKCGALLETIRDSEENLLQCHLVHHKSHMKLPGKETVLCK
jgi:hypothetical protein